MTDPTFTNDNDMRDADFVGFAGAPVRPPPSWAYDPLSDELDDERQTMFEYARCDHYVQVGVAHATEVVDRLIAQRRGVDTEGIDLETAVAQFTLTDSEGHNDYTDALLLGLAREADALESTANGSMRGSATSTTIMPLISSHV